jgi:rhodanese-related sulfurtransferase
MALVMVLFAAICLSPLTCFGAWQDLTAQELKGLLDSGREVFLLNTLSDLEFNEGHIPGSVNVPLHEFMRSKALPEDKDTMIISYCLSQK